MMWRLYPSYFNEPGKYVFELNGEAVEILVDKNRVFTPSSNDLPWHAIATLVGGKKDGH